MIALKNAVFMLSLLFFVEGAPQSRFMFPGQRLYEKNCSFCHGKVGDRQRFGAKNLRVSRAGDSALFTIISKGLNRMPAWSSTFSDREIHDVIQYIKTLRS